MNQAFMRNLTARNLATYFLAGLIQAYRYVLAPLLPGRCRYLPSCSHYGLEALHLHGPIHGSWLTLRRLTRCHPWGGHGYDPVPQRHPPRPSYEIDKATPHV